MTHELEMPDFLRRKPIPFTYSPHQKPKRHWVKSKPPKPKKRAKAGIDEGTRAILFTLGWSSKIISRLSPKEANELADAGKRMQPVDETMYGRTTK